MWLCDVVRRRLGYVFSNACRVLGRAVGPTRARSGDGQVPTSRFLSWLPVCDICVCVLVCPVCVWSRVVMHAGLLTTSKMYSKVSIRDRNSISDSVVVLGIHESSRNSSRRSGD